MKTLDRITELEGLLFRREKSLYETRQALRNAEREIAELNHEVKTLTRIIQQFDRGRA